MCYVCNGMYIYYDILCTTYVHHCTPYTPILKAHEMKCSWLEFPRHGLPPRLDKGLTQLKRGQFAIDINVQEDLRINS